MLRFSRTMSASGKGRTPPPAGTADGPDRAAGIGGVDRATAVSGASEIEALDEVKATRAVDLKPIDAVSSTAPAAAVDPVATVAAALRAGELTVEQAVDRLIEDAVTRRVGRALEPGSELEARLRRVLRDYASADPLITAKIRRLEGRRSGR